MCDIIQRMPYRLTPLVNNSYYHIFNRGVEKRIIFSNERDHQRFLETLYYYQFSGPKPQFSTRNRFKNNNFKNNPKIIEIICYCLMPNHFHLLIKQLKNKGIQEFMQKVINSYTKYYNTKHRRVGHLFQGAFKAVAVEKEEQLLHVSRYIHLNPHAAGITNTLENYPYSSYPHYIGLSYDKLCESNIVLDLFKNSSEYKEFVIVRGDYARELEQIKQCLLDSED